MAEPTAPAVGPAQASRPAPAGGVNWAAVAACESGGNWRVSTGNGFYGGLQFDSSRPGSANGSGAVRRVGPTWPSRAEQIAVAQQVLAGQGIGAWPVCGARG